MKKNQPKPLTPAQIRSLCELRNKLGGALKYINLALENPAVNKVCYTSILDGLIDKLNDAKIFANFVKYWNN